jgi:hypothetical protein
MINPPDLIIISDWAAVAPWQRVFHSFVLIFYGTVAAIYLSRILRHVERTADAAEQANIILRDALERDVAESAGLGYCSEEDDEEESEG